MNALKSGDLDRIGTLLDETWQIKKRFASGVSNPDIDDMYEKAIRGGAMMHSSSSDGSSLSFAASKDLSLNLLPGAFVLRSLFTSLTFWLSSKSLGLPGSP